MLVPNRHKDASSSYNSYRYGFQGQEKDDELKGEGNSLNYEFRMHDPRVGRFFAVDPLTDKYAMLTPYQFSSNRPIDTVELDGLEGVSYRVLKKDTNGNLIPLKRVIELDIYIATNEKATKGAYSNKQYDELTSIITKKYNDNKFTDEDGLSVEFKFNYEKFDPEKFDPTKKASEIANKKIETLSKTPDFFDQETGENLSKNYNSIPGAVIWNDNSIIPAGQTIGNKIQIKSNDTSYDFGHKEAHEISHFLHSAYGFLKDVPNKLIEDGHNLKGFMRYNIKKIDLTTGDELDYSKSIFKLSKENFNVIIKGVPRIEDKIEN